MDTIMELVSAIQARAWYGAAALLITLTIALWRNVQPRVWDRIPKRWQWVPAVLVAAAGAFVAAWQSGATWQQALAVSVYSGLTTGTSAIGLAHTGKRLLDGGGTEPGGSADPSLEASKPSDPTS